MPDINEAIFLQKCLSCTTVIEKAMKEMACCFDFLITATNRVQPIIFVSSFKPKFWAEEILYGSGLNTSVSGFWIYDTKMNRK